jgi:acyl-CoA synthetase (AMP-forming)/AMP-acid ligase II
MTTFTGPPVETEEGIGALTFGGFLDELAERYADRPAHLWAPADGPRVTWTYRQLREHARSVAKALVATGATRGTRVAVLMANRPEWIASVWGAAMAGGVAVPFNTFAEARELDHLLRHSDVAVVLTQSSLLRHHYVDDLFELCPEVRAGAPGRIDADAYPFLRRIVVLDAGTGPASADIEGAVQLWEDFLDEGVAVPDAVIDRLIEETVPAEDGIIIYSSGSTSLPKGVLHRHRGPMLQCWRHAHREQFSPEDRVFTGLPFFWTAGFAAALGATLASGACLVTASSFEPHHVLRVIEEERITIVQGPANQDVELRTAQERDCRDLSSIRRDLYRLTGGPAPDDAARPASRAAYGSSETFTSATAVPEHAPVVERATSGRLIAGSSMRILDRESGAFLGPDEEGEILVKGLTMMRGYVKVPPEDTFDEDGYFHTGDLGWFDDAGLLHFTGRLTNMIRTSGANVSPVEVELVLMGHPDIHRAVVVGVPDDVAGELVLACVVPRDGAKLSEDEVRGRLRGSLSSYKIPRRVLVFASEDELPRTGGNKFNIPAMSALAAELIAAGH